MPKDQVKQPEKPEINPNDYPDYGDYMAAKKAAEKKDK